MSKVQIQKVIFVKGSNPEVKVHQKFVSKVNVQLILIVDLSKRSSRHSHLF